MKRIFIMALGCLFSLTAYAQQPDAELYKEIMEAQKKGAIQLTPEALKVYEGTYEIQPGFTLRFFVQEGTLMSQATGQEAHRMLAKGDHVFVPETFPATVTFLPDEGGAMNEVILSQSGQVYKAPRIDE